MSKIFLYIDESKDFQNNQMYLWSIISTFGPHTLDKHLEQLLPYKFQRELKSTKSHDCEMFKDMSVWNKNIYWCYAGVYDAKNDKDYLSCLKSHTLAILSQYDQNVTTVEMIVDFNRLDSNMSKVEKAFSRSLSETLKIPVILSFKNSKSLLAIQFADLTTWIYRKQHKKS